MPNNKLKLTKTHDSCISNHPRLAVVMIHGIASDSSTYDHAIKYLNEQKSLSDIRLVTFDLLGSGKSLKDDKLNYDYKDQLEILYEKEAPNHYWSNMANNFKNSSGYDFYYINHGS